MWCTVHNFLIAFAFAKRNIVRTAIQYVICEDYGMAQSMNKPLRYRILVYPEFNGQLISHSVAIMSPSHLPHPLNSPEEMLAKITEERNSNYRPCLSYFKEFLIYVDLLLDTV